MPGQVLNITNGPISRPSGATTQTQPGREALDVSSAPGNRFDFSLKCVFLDGTSFVVTLQTSMYNDDNPGNWTNLVAFDPITASNTVEINTVDEEVLRYLRWTVSYTSVTNATFEILGMAW